METKSKSPNPKKNPRLLWRVFSCCVAIPLLVLNSCDSMPHIFGGSEVPPDTLNEERLVAKPTPRDIADPNWPRLGDVPAKPYDFSSQTDIDNAMNSMRQDRSEGQTMKQNVEGLTDMQPATGD